MTSPEEFIQDRLAQYDQLIPFDDFSELATAVAHIFDMPLKPASDLVNKLKGDKEVGSQEFRQQGFGKNNLWQGQNEAHNFSKHNPGELAEPKASLKVSFNKGDTVRVVNNDEAPWGAEYTGVIERINDQNTCDIKDLTTGEIRTNQPLKLLKNPIGEGRPDVRIQQRRVGDPKGMGESHLDSGDPNAKREYPNQMWMPNGQADKDIKNPKSLFYKEARPLSFLELEADAYEWRDSPLKGGFIKGRLNWLPAAVAEGRPFKEQWDTTPLSDGDLYLLKLRSQKGLVSDEYYRNEQSYFNEWHSGKWDDELKERIKREVLERAVSHYQAEHNGELPPHPTFLPEYFPLGSWVNILKGDYTGKEGTVTDVEPEKNTIDILFKGEENPTTINNPLEVAKKRTVGRPPVPKKEAPAPSRAHTNVVEELAEVLKNFQPGMWHAVGYGQTNTVNKILHFLKLKAQMNEPLPTVTEIASYLGADPTNVYRHMHTILDRAKIAKTGPEGMRKLLEQPRIKPEPEKPLAVNPPQVGYGRAGRPSLIDHYRNRFPLPEEQYKRIRALLDSMGRMMLDEYQKGQFNSAAYWEEKGIPYPQARDRQKQIIGFIGSLMKEGSKGPLKDFCRVQRPSNGAKGIVLKINDSKPGDIDVLVLWDIPHMGHDIFETDIGDIESVDEIPSEEEVAAAKEQLEKHLKDKATYEKEFQEKVQGVKKEAKWEKYFPNGTGKVDPSFWTDYDAGKLSNEDVKEIQEIIKSPGIGFSGGYEVVEVLGPWEGNPGEGWLTFPGGQHSTPKQYFDYQKKRMEDGLNQKRPLRRVKWFNTKQPPEILEEYNPDLKKEAHCGPCTPLKMKAIEMLSDMHYKSNNFDRKYLGQLGAQSDEASSANFTKTLNEVLKQIQPNKDNEGVLRKLHQIATTLEDIQNRIDDGEFEAVDKPKVKADKLYSFLLENIVKEYGEAAANEVVSFLEGSVKIPSRRLSNILIQYKLMS